MSTGELYVEREDGGIVGDGNGEIVEDVARWVEVFVLVKKLVFA